MIIGNSNFVLAPYFSDKNNILSLFMLFFSKNNSVNLKLICYLLYSELLE